MFKKLLCFVLAVIMIFEVCPPIFAAQNEYAVRHDREAYVEIPQNQLRELTVNDIPTEGELTWQMSLMGSYVKMTGFEGDTIELGYAAAMIALDSRNECTLRCVQENGEVVRTFTVKFTEPEIEEIKAEIDRDIDVETIAVVTEGEIPFEESEPLVLEASESVPSEPDASESVPAELEVSESVPAEPEISESTPAEPEASESVPAEPEASESVPAEPEASESVPAEPEASESVPAEPETSESVPAEPEVSETSAASEENADSSVHNADAKINNSENEAPEEDISAEAEGLDKRVLAASNIPNDAGFQKAEDGANAGLRILMTSEEAEQVLADAESKKSLANEPRAMENYVNVTVKYEYEVNGVITPGPDGFGRQVGKGEKVVIVFPVIKGYKAYIRETLPGTGGKPQIKDTEATGITIESVLTDTNIHVVYKPAMTTFKVVKRFQNVLDNRFGNEEPNIVTQGEGMSFTTVDVSKYSTPVDGFTPRYTAAPEIKPDGTTVVEIFYDRNIYAFLFVLGKNGYGMEPIYAKYGTNISEFIVKTPVRAGYKFKYWYIDDKTYNPDDPNAKLPPEVKLDTFMPIIEPDKITVFTALWEENPEAKTRVIIWGEKANSTDIKDHTQYDFLTEYALDKVKPGTQVTVENVLLCKNTDPGHTHDSSCYAWDENLWHLNHQDKPKVEADGSTITNAYLERNANFELAFFGWNVPLGGKHIHTIGPYKWGKDIAGEYKANLLDTGYGDKWYDKKTNEVFSGFTVMPPKSREFWRAWGQESQHDTANDFLENIPVEGQTEPVYGTPKPVTIDYSLFDSAPIIKDIPPRIYEGFTFLGVKPKGAKPEDAPIADYKSCNKPYKDSEYYYSRNKHTISFFSGNKTEPIKVYEVYYGEDLKNEKFTGMVPNVNNDDPDHNDYPDNLETDAYEFQILNKGQANEQKGWYTSPSAPTPFDFNQTMPDVDIALYAKWIPKKRHVTAYYDENHEDADHIAFEGDFDHGSIIIIPDAEAGVLDAPEYFDSDLKDILIFDRWYYYDAMGREKVFDRRTMPITRNLKIYGKWKSEKEARGLVSYMYQPVDEGGNPKGEPVKIAPNLTGKLIVGEERTLYPVIDNEFYPEYRGKNLYPMESSHILRVVPETKEETESGTIAEGNKHIFWYEERIPPIEYKIQFRYSEADGSASIIPKNDLPDFITDPANHLDKYEKSEIYYTDETKTTLLYPKFDASSSTLIMGTHKFEISFTAPPVIKHKANGENVACAAIPLSITFPISAVSSQNVKVFHYIENSKLGQVNRNYYFEAFDDNFYLGKTDPELFSQNRVYYIGKEPTPEQVQGVIGGMSDLDGNPMTPDKVTKQELKIRSYHGFTFDPAHKDSKLYGLLGVNDLDLNIYMKRNRYPYKILYLERGSNAELTPVMSPGAPPSEGMGKFDETIRFKPQEVTNYRYAGKETYYDMKIVAEDVAEQNTHIFWYDPIEPSFTLKLIAPEDSDQKVIFNIYGHIGGYVKADMQVAVNPGEVLYVDRLSVGDYTVTMDNKWNWRHPKTEIAFTTTKDDWGQTVDTFFYSDGQVLPEHEGIKPMQFVTPPDYAAQHYTAESTKSAEKAKWFNGISSIDNRFSAPKN